MKTITFTVLVAMVLLGCPPKDEAKKDGIGPCKKVGDSCEVSPGKLGSCVAIDICEKPPCGFACQSQH